VKLGQGRRLGAEARRPAAVARDVGSRVASASVGRLGHGVRPEARAAAMSVEAAQPDGDGPGRRHKGRRAFGGGGARADSEATPCSGVRRQRRRRR
jgi:hypothetical protein